MTDQPVLSYRFQDNPQRPVILYLHGFLGDAEDWGDTMVRLGESFSHLAVDLSGHGDTADAPLDDHDFTMTGCAARLVGLLDFLNINKCHIAAYSMGGRLGLFLLIHYSGRIERAVIEAASPGLDSDIERAARKAYDYKLAEDLENSDYGDFLERWYAQPLFSTVDLTEPRFQDLLQRRRHGDPRQLARSLRLMGTGVQPSLWSRLGLIASPVLFVAGEHDQKFRSLAESMRRLCRQGQVAIIPGAGHNSHFERPAEYAETVRRFLTEQR